MNPIRLEQVPCDDPSLRGALADAQLPTDDIEDAGRSFFKVISGDGQMIGFSGIEHCGNNYLLRSIVVLPEHRRHGVGRAVVHALLASLEDDSDVFLATTNAASFFENLGFVEIPRQSLPASVLATRQLSAICPSSATIMKLARPPT